MQYSKINMNFKISFSPGEQVLLRPRKTRFLSNERVDISHCAVCQILSICALLMCRKRVRRFFCLPFLIKMLLFPSLPCRSYVPVTVRNASGIYSSMSSYQSQSPFVIFVLVFVAHSQIRAVTCKKLTGIVISFV